VSVEPFTCPECGSHYFGSRCERRPDGSFWKIAEECHDQYKKGCRFVRRVEVLIFTGRKAIDNPVEIE